MISFLSEIISARKISHIWKEIFIKCIMALTVLIYSDSIMIYII